VTRKHELPGPGAALSSRRRPVGRALTLILAMALAGLLFGGPAVAGRYEYPREGRPDPFTPFIKPKVLEQTQSFKNYLISLQFCQ